MARKRTRRAKAKEQFMILTSSCGDIRQLEAVDLISSTAF